MAKGDEREEFIRQTSSPSTRPTFDDVLQRLGNPGRFQVIQIALALNAQIVMTFQSLSFVLGYEPSHVCNSVNETSFLAQHGLLNDSTATVSYGSCDLIVSSNQTGQERHVLTTSCPEGRNFSDSKDTTWLSYWDLVCESRGPAELTYSAYNAGWIVGGFLASHLADRYGRKVVFLVGYFCVFCTESSILFAPNIFFIIALRFFGGVFRSCLNTTFYVLCIELVVPKHREMCGLMMGTLWIPQAMCVGIVAYVFQDSHWRYLQGLGVVSAAFSFVYPFFLSESPRWLTTKGRHREALDVLKRACTLGGKDFDEVKSLYLLSVGDQSDRNQNADREMKYVNGKEEQGLSTVLQTGGPKTSVFTLLGHKDLLVLTLCTTFVTFGNNVTYLGLYMVSTSLVGNRFLNYCIMCLVEVPSTLLMYVLMKRVGRLTVLRFFLSLTWMAVLASSLMIAFGNDTPAIKISITVLSILGTFSSTSSFSMILIISPEIFPTNLRSTGDAFVISCSRFGAMAVPFLRPLMTVVKWGPSAIFATVCGLALIITCFIPETKNKELFNSVSDLKQSLRRNRKVKNRKDGHDVAVIS